MSSPFNLQTSFKRAEKRLGLRTPPARKQRSDLGVFRIPEATIALLRRSLSGTEFPGIPKILNELEILCQEQRQPMPSRATVYKFIKQYPGPTYPISELPRAVRKALYNLSEDTSVPGAQLAFYCFNYGNLKAVQYAAGLPWWPLYQACRMRGWRPKSQGLLLAVMRARGISRG